MELEGIITVITGAASGLGEASARYLVGKGSSVAILDLADGAGNKIAEELGDKAIYCKTDVTDEKSVQSAIHKTMDKFGAVHVALNCAGVATPGKVVGKEGPMPIGGFNKVVQINLIGTMNVIRLAAEKMILNNPNQDGERGVIINTASIAAFEGQYGQAAYAASKAGVVGMALPIARELAVHGIRVLTIAPGLFHTAMMAGLSDKVRESLENMTLFPHRLGKAEEFAKLACHIIENPMLNAEVIRLDGGIRMGAR